MPAYSTMDAYRDSLPPPTKRQRQRQSCPRCCVSLSKSSFYEHVSQCCPETSLIGPSETENLSDSLFELDEGESTVFYDPPDCSSSGFTDHNEPPNEIEHPLVDCTSTVSEEDSCDISCPPNFSDDSNTESESEGEPDSLTSEVS